MPVSDNPFDEDIYLRLNPDVRQAVTVGAFRSGREHFERYGRAEGRPWVRPESVVRDRVVMTGRPVRQVLTAPAASVDTVQVSPSGALFVVGWVDDAQDPLESIDVFVTSWSVSFDAATLGRLRRIDAEGSLGRAARHAYGYWTFLYAARPLASGHCSVILRLKSGTEASFAVTASSLDDHEMRKIVLAHLAGAAYFGNPYFLGVAAIAPAIGAQLVAFNQLLTRRALQSPYVERFGAVGRRYRGSIIVCLYGKPEFMFLQMAMFARQAGIGDYEFIYVSNSPHIAEALLREARLCTRIYGVDISVVALHGNAGFGAANNAAVPFAASARLLVMNPDVFPYHADFIARHDAVVEGCPAPQTDLFGVPLYYDDGSLMHAGMHVEVDRLPHLGAGARAPTQVLRVEHYGKGAPAETARFLAPRAVPAVTGAFMSLARGWFERLGGFTQDYVFGHYEDADFCLKSSAAGRTAWLHDARLWHLEGKGSARLAQHEGGAIVNRWLFTKTWGETVTRDVIATAPTRLRKGAGRRG
jgi:GT2 family glycosyltransferase